jgi:hypothetical protein
MNLSPKIATPRPPRMPLALSFLKGSAAHTRYKASPVAKLPFNDAGTEYRGPRRRKPLLTGEPSMTAAPVPISRMMPRQFTPGPKVARYLPNAAGMAAKYSPGSGL